MNTLIICLPSSKVNSPTKIAKCMLTMGQQIFSLLQVQYLATNNCAVFWKTDQNITNTEIHFCLYENI